MPSGYSNCGVYPHYNRSNATKAQLDYWDSMKGKPTKGFIKGCIPMHPFPKGNKLGKNSKGRKKGTYNHTEETKRKIKEANTGKKKSVESRQKMRERRIANPNKIFKDTKIELKIEAELVKREINYQKQVPLCKVAVVDFYLPEHKIVIQADGDYWHNLLDHKKRDANQDGVLKLNGFNVYRFWEHEINESVEECINKIKFI